MSSALQATPTSPSSAWRSRFCKISEFTKSPKGRRTHLYRPNGAGKVRVDWIFLQDAVPVTMAEVDFTEDFCSISSKVSKDVLKHWKLLEFPL